MRLRVWFSIATITIFLAACLAVGADIKQEIATATDACGQDAAAGNETARSTCAEKLANIADKLVNRFREKGERDDDALNAVWAELKKYPMPADADSKKLSKLLVGKWDSPRHTYAFKANGKYGLVDEPATQTWKIVGNKFAQEDSKNTIILLDSKYFIYTDGDAVFFHSRAK